MATTTRKSTVHAAARPRALALAVATAFLPWYLPQTTYAQAPDPNSLPTGGQITNGAGQIHAPQGTHLQIDQYTQKMIAEFGSFSIGANASVNLSQPGASSIALFRDVGGDPSKIFGNLSANGQLFISNQNGVLFGASARVDVGALFATSLSITDHDFMAGRYHWYNEGNAGNVVNEGQIVTANGYTALVGPQVRNDGIIIARAGSVALAAGDRVSLDMIGDGLISLSVDQSAYNASVINTGSITADGGTVLLTARSANALLDTVINNSGTIRANSLVERNGQIVLDGGNAGVVSVTGTLEAKGIEAGTKGGTIHALGESVGIFGNAILDASGQAGGGEIRIGGGWQGGEGLSEAQNTFLGRDAIVRADALHKGDGGSIVMWAQGSTRAHGTISVRGGAEDGDGGRVETSGLNGLEVTRAPDLSAPKGKGGLWLLDPHNLTVVDTAVNSNYDADPAGTFTSNADGADIADEVIEAALNNGGAGGATVVLATGSGGAEAGTIDVQASIDFNGASSSTLVMRAHDDIIFTAGVTAAGSGLNLHLFANDNTNVGGALAGSTRSAEAVSGNGDVLVNALLSLNGGAFQSSGRNFNNTAGITTGGGNVAINHLGNVAIGAAVNAGGGTVDIDFGQANGGSTFTLTAALTGGTKTVTGGTGNDVFDLNGAPTTTATLDGGTGSDRIELTSDTDFTLSNTSLTTISGHDLTLAAMEVANLTGGAADNSFTVSGWSGTGTLDGAGGTGDSIVAVNDVATIDLTNTSLARATLGTLTLANIEVADLTGGAGVNAFTVSSWTGSATLTGLGADDSYSITFNGTVGSVTVVDAAGAADSITVNGTAGADAFTLTNSAVSTAGETVNYTGADIETLAVNGLAGDDTFTASALTRAATVDGGLDSDTIIATNDVANMTLTNTTLDRTGTTQLTLAGMEVANLTGGVNANTFTLSGWSGSASITGGGGTDTLVGPNVTNTWTIDGTGDGNINGTVVFIDISNLTGGTTTDTFIVTTGSLAGNIDGGTGANSINIAAVPGANTINLQAGTVSTVLGGTFTNVTSFIGDNTADTLVGTNANTAWTLSGANDGSLSTGQTFTDIPSLTGGTLDDSFTLTSGTLSGSINGAGGNDTLSGSTTYVVTGGNSGTATGVTGGFSNIENLVGTAGVDTFTLSGGTLAGTVDGLAGTDTLTGANVANTWTITGPNSGTLTGTGGWLNIENLVGGTNTDSFSGVPAGSVGGTISDGGGGATTLSGTINSSGSQTYSAAVSSAGVTLNAGTAAISATNAGNNFTGPLSVTGSTASISNMNALTIGANLTGGLTTMSGALTYVAGTSVGSLNSTASGAVNQTGPSTVTGATNINAGGNAITLTSANDFQGTVSLIGGTTQIRDTNSLTLGSVNTGALTTVNTGALNLGSGTVNGAWSSTTNGGNVTQTGALGVTGTTNLQAGAGSIVLAMANDFGGAVAASGIGIIFNDVNTLTPGTIDAGSGSVSLSANSLGAGGTVSAGSASSLSSNTNVNGLDINMPNVPLALSVTATQWNFTSTPTSIPQPNPVTVPGGNVGVSYNLASIIASVAQQQAASASSSVSATVAAVIVDEANKTFGTDSVAEDVEYGFAGEVGTTPPMDHRIDESGISLPRCVQESREGVACK